MRFRKKKTEKKTKKNEKKARRGFLRDIIDGSVLTKDVVTRQLPFILFLAFLAVVYIANRYHAEKIIRETMTIQSELKELRSKKIAVESELMYISKQSVVAEMVEEANLGLEESVEPPYKITVREK